MDIGIYLRLFGRPGSDPAPPGWSSLLDAARAAEAAAFDRVVFEDVLLYPGDEGNEGVWDPTVVAAAVAASTERIGIAHAVVNNPYYHPAIIARAAATLDEVCGGRYSLGIGLGNTPDDYPRFGIPADRRYSRLAESITAIVGLLRDGHATVDGEFVTMPAGELVLRGPRPSGPPIIIAGAKPKMLRLAATHADEWNWWSGDPSDPASRGELVGEIDRACEEVGRDPSTLRRSIDLFSIMPGPADEVAERILAWKALRFDEVRLDLVRPDGMTFAEAVASMREIVERVHRD